MVELYPYDNMEILLDLTIKFERQLKAKSQYTSSSSTWNKNKEHINEELNGQDRAVLNEVGQDWI